jgi:hypothetical protein
MSVDNHMPDWAQSLFEAIASTIQFKGMAHLEGRYSAPDETAWGTHFLEMSPALIDLTEHGLAEGELAYGILHSFDLKAAGDGFDEVAALVFGIENDGRPCITMEGTIGGREVVVQIFTEPFEDGEVVTELPQVTE